MPYTQRIDCMETRDKKSIEKEMLYSLVKALYGERIGEKELTEVRQSVESVVEDAYMLRSIRLKISDEPAMVFKPQHRCT
ncbi:MAG: hypothetical protein QXI32_01860 [Candidatus Bathyarchaeia archaeon]